MPPSKDVYYVRSYNICALLVFEPRAQWKLGGRFPGIRNIIDGAESTKSGGATIGHATGVVFWEGGYGECTPPLNGVV